MKFGVIYVVEQDYCMCEASEQCGSVIDMKRSPNRCLRAVQETFQGQT